MSDEVWLSPCWDTPEKIAYARECVLRLWREGMLTDEEKAVANGNLDEAAALLRLRKMRKET
jgi:hypothetical protein